LLPDDLRAETAGEAATLRWATSRAQPARI
jgi:hypothetical protein